MPPFSASRHRLRALVLLVAVMATVVGLLTWSEGLARAATTDCAGPVSIAAKSFYNSGAFQPVYTRVTLSALGGNGNPLGSCASATAGPIQFDWSPAPSSGTGGAVNVESDTEGQIAYSVHVHQVQNNADVDLGSASVTITYSDPEFGVTLGRPKDGGYRVTDVFTFEVHTSSPTPVATYTWNFGDGTPPVVQTPALQPGTQSTQIEHTYSAPGTYPVSVRAVNVLGQSGRYAGGMYLTVAPPYAPLVAGLSVSPTDIPIGTPVRADGTSSTTESDYTITGYTWDFGDGTSATGPTVSHLYATTGTYTITETVDDSALREETASQTVTVTSPPVDGGGSASSGSPPVASWSDSPSQPVAGAAVAFDGSPSSDSDGHITGYSWNFGGGATDTAVNPTHVFPHAGDYPVTLTVTDDQGQTGSSTQTIHVAQAPPTATFTVPTDATAGTPVPFDGSGASDPDGSIRSWSWDFGDGTPVGSGSAPTHPYQHAGSYDVTLTVTDNDGNTDSVTHPVSVSRTAPEAAFAAPATAVAASPASFDGSPSADVDGTITDWSWDFGDGTPVHGQSAGHTFPHAGSYPVTLTVTDDAGLTGSVSHDVTVAGAAPTAAFTAPTASSGTPVTFDGTGSSDPDGTVTGYHWQFGDGTPAVDGATPAHSFPGAGSYPVTLTVTDDSGLTGQVTHLVAVGAALPTAAFIGPSAGTAGQTLSFDGSGSTDPGSAITAWNWTFGDGKSATGAKPTHVFATPGTYSVALTVADAAGRIATVTHPVTVRWPATDLAVATSGATPKAGQYTYTITVKNLGKSAAHTVRLLATLDPTQVLAAKPVAPTGLVCAGVPVGATGTITCKAATATLAAGKTWVVKLTVKQPTAPKVASVTEVSQVDGANPDPVSANNVARMTTALPVKH